MDCWKRTSPFCSISTLIVESKVLTSLAFTNIAGPSFRLAFTVFSMRTFRPERMVVPPAGSRESGSTLASSEVKGEVAIAAAGAGSWTAAVMADGLDRITKARGRDATESPGRIDVLKVNEAAGVNITGPWIWAARVGVEVRGTEVLEIETELGFNEGLANDVAAVWGVAQRDEARPVLLFAKAGVGVRPITETPPTIRGGLG